MYIRIVRSHLRSNLQSSWLLVANLAFVRFVGMTAQEAAMSDAGSSTDHAMPRHSPPTSPTVDLYDDITANQELAVSRAGSMSSPAGSSEPWGFTAKAFEAPADVITLSPDTPQVRTSDAIVVHESRTGSTAVLFQS